MLSELISVMEWLRSWPLKNFLAGVTLSICTSSFDAAAVASRSRSDDDDDDDVAAPLGRVEAVTVTSGCVVDDDFLLCALPGPLPTTGDPA